MVFFSWSCRTEAFKASSSTKRSVGLLCSCVKCLYDCVSLISARLTVVCIEISRNARPRSLWLYSLHVQTSNNCWKSTDFNGLTENERSENGRPKRAIEGNYTFSKGGKQKTEKWRTETEGKLWLNIRTVKDCYEHGLCQRVGQWRSQEFGTGSFSPSLPFPPLSFPSSPSFLLNPPFPYK